MIMTRSGYATPEAAARTWDSLARAEGVMKECLLNFPHGKPRAELEDSPAEDSGSAAEEEEAEVDLFLPPATSTGHQARGADSAPPARPKRARSQTPPPPAASFADQLRAAASSVDAKRLRKLISEKEQRSAQRLAARAVMDREEAEEEEAVAPLRSQLVDVERASLRRLQADLQAKQAALEAEQAAVAAQLAAMDDESEDEGESDDDPSVPAHTKSL